MNDRTTADALARELVARGAFRWVAGMRTRSSKRLKGGTVIAVTATTLTIALDEPHTWLDRLHRVRTSKLDDVAPDLEHEPTAACLAVQAVEAGAQICYWYDHSAPFWTTEWGLDLGYRHAKGPLGIVAARALIALGGDRG